MTLTVLPPYPGPGTAAAPAARREGRLPSDRHTVPTDARAADSRSAETRTADDEFRAFMSNRWPNLLRTAYLLTGSHHDAEDIAQGALATAYAKWSRVRRSDDVAAYVRQIMVHQHIDRFRRRTVREWLTDRLPHSPVADQTARVAEHGALVVALAELPARQRAAVVLCYFEDMTHAQVAAVLGTRVGTVRGQISRALARLRENGALADAVGRHPESRTETTS